jgi:hypothetical protein
MCKVLCVVCLVSVAAFATLAYALTYSQCEVRMNNVAGDVERCQSGYTATSAQVAGIVNTLTALPTTYKSVIDEINAQVAAAPTDPEWLALKGRLTKLTSEFLALKAKVAVAANCFAAIESKGHAAVQVALDGIK